MKSLRRLAVVVLVLLAAFVVVDRVAKSAAQRVVARRIQADQQLAARPDVTIGGFPFLTQLVDGTYDDVTVTVRGPHAGDLVVTKVTVHASGVHVPFSAVVGQHLHRVPIDRATAQVVLAFPDLNGFFAGQHVRLQAGPNAALRVTGTVAGVTASVGAKLSLQGDSVLIGPGSGLPSLAIPLGSLPFKIRLLSVKATQDGIVVSGSATGLVLRT